MKKKAKRYAEGGEPKFERSTYERARAMLRDNPATADELTPSLDERIANARERIAAFTQSTPEPAPSRSAASQDRPAVSQDRPAYPTARRVADAMGEESDRREQEQQAAAERGRDFVRDADITVPPAAGLAPRSAPIAPAPAPALTRRQTDAAARREAEYSDVAGVEDYEAGQAAKRMMREAEQARSPRLQSQLAVRQAQQMEEKGSIYSPDYGLSRAEREQRQSLRDLARGLERTDEDVQAARRRADTAAARRAAASAASRDIEDYETGQAARAAMRSSRRAEVESNREREEAEEGAARKRQRARAAIPPVPAPGTRAFANAPERAQRRSERQNERNLANEVKRAALQDILERSRTTRETAALRRRSDESSPTFKKGGMVSSASKRADGIATKGKTRGKYL